MTDDSKTADPVPEPYKPYQFTVRTFFAAAIWLSLLLAAINTLEEEALATVVLALVWVAFAELYRRFRATRPMVALCGGPVVLLVLWCVVLIATESPWRGSRVLPPVPSFFLYALGWGIAISVVVVIERGIDRWVVRRARRRRNADTSGSSGSPPPAHFAGQFQCAAILFGIHAVIALLALLALATWTGPRRPPTSLEFLGFAIVAIVDLPVVPVYISVGFDPPRDIANLALPSLLLGGMLYAVVGLLVAHVAERFQRKAPVADPSKSTSTENRPTQDGQEP